METKKQHVVLYQKSYKDQCRRLIARVALSFGYVLAPSLIDYVYAFGPFHRDQMSRVLRHLPSYLVFECVMKNRPNLKHTFKRVHVQIVQLDNYSRALHTAYLVTCCSCLPWSIILALVKQYDAIEDWVYQRVYTISVSELLNTTSYITLELTCFLHTTVISECRIKKTRFPLQYMCSRLET